MAGTPNKQSKSVALSVKPDTGPIAAQPVEQMYFVPEYGVSVMATSSEDAIAKASKGAEKK